MKKFFLIGGLCLFCVSCFRYHKAARIDSYELQTPENGVVRLTRYAFQFTGNPKRLTNRIKTFFDLHGNDNVHEFETDRFLTGQTVKVYLSSGQDQDKTFGLGNILQGIEDHKNEKFDREHGIKTAHPQVWIIDPAKINYLYVQVMDENGNDVLAQSGLQKQQLIAQLNAFRIFLNR